MLAGSVLIIGTIILAASTTIAQLIAGRVITGVVGTTCPITLWSCFLTINREWESTALRHLPIWESAAPRNTEAPSSLSRAWWELWECF